MKTIYSANDITKATGLSYRQVDYLARTGVLGPSLADANGKGTRRIYDEQDVTIAKIVGEAKHMGLNAKVIRELVEFLKSKKNRMKEEQVLVIEKEGFRILNYQELTEALVKSPGAIVISVNKKNVL